MCACPLDRIAVLGGQSRGAPHVLTRLRQAIEPSDGTFVLQNPASRLCAGLFGVFMGLQNCDLSSANQRFVLVAA